MKLFGFYNSMKQLIKCVFTCFLILLLGCTRKANDTVFVTILGEDMPVSVEEKFIIESEIM
jgi:hypothetical protein